MTDFIKESATSIRRYLRDYDNEINNPNPTLLFIGCVDSRIIPEEMLGAVPGDMMVVRVPGGLVHAQGLGTSSTTATVEMTLRRAPNVTDIVVCGHTDCLALEELGRGVDAIAEPNLARWLAMGDFVRAQASTQADPATDYAAYRLALLESSIKRSLDSLRELPIVRAKEASGHVVLHGWYVDVANQRLMVYQASDTSFVPADASHTIARPKPATPAAASVAPAPVAVAAPVIESLTTHEYTGPEVPVDEWLKSIDAEEVPIDEAAILAGIDSFGESVAPASVEPASVSPASVAPDPVHVPKARPAQRAYVSEVSSADNTSAASQQRFEATPSTYKPPMTTAEQDFADDQRDQRQANIGLPSNVADAVNDPALDDLRTALGNLRRPAGRMEMRQMINEMNNRESWQNLADVVREMNDPQVRQSLREIAFELKSPQARSELRQMIASLDAGENPILQNIVDIDPNKVRSDFQNMINQLRENKK